MKKTTLKKTVTLLMMTAFWTTASPIGVDTNKDSNNDSVNEMKEQCDKERNANMVAHWST